ncbi:MAG: FAD:protein FMN transferase [Lachnospiraceae bacterium]|nr:FAD:protein FMN transferase [Lachnospiraceae bacterium]
MTLHKKTGIFLGTALLTALLLNGCNQSPSSPSAPRQEYYEKQEFALSTEISIRVYTEEDAEVLDGCFSLIREYEQKLSRTLKDSEIARLNRREISEISEETAELLAAGLHYSELSDGAYDVAIATLTSLWDFLAEKPAVPDEDKIREAAAWADYTAVHLDGTTVTFDNDITGVDLGSIAKGYIADRVKEYLTKNGVKNALISLGGNILLLGSKPDGSDFKIGIQEPFGSRDSYIGVASLSDLSLVTSGIYERYFEEDGKGYHHILNPNTGYPYENNLLSVTIIGPDSMDCDGLSTACFSLGLEKGMALIDRIPEYYAIFVTDDGKQHFSDGLMEHVSYQER